MSIHKFADPVTEAQHDATVDQGLDHLYQVMSTVLNGGTCQTCTLHLLIMELSAKYLEANGESATLALLDDVEAHVRELLKPQPGILSDEYFIDQPSTPSH